MKALPIIAALALGLPALSPAAFAQDAPAAGKEYPVCSKSVQDECMNATAVAAKHGMAHRPMHKKHRAMATPTKS